MKKINKDELFCIKCLIPDRFFREGGSWSIDICPKCGGTACIMYQDLSLFRKFRVHLYEIILTFKKGKKNESKRQKFKEK